MPSKQLKQMIQLVGGKPADYLQARPRIWTQPTVKQIQVVARAGLEPETDGLQVRRAVHSATLPPLNYFCLVWFYQPEMQETFSVFSVSTRDLQASEGAASWCIYILLIFTLK